eukprot:gene16969-18680_t
MESSSFIGDTIKIDCGDKGVYRGKVLEIDTLLQEITIEDVFLNEMQIAAAQLKIKIEDVVDLSILLHETQPKTITPPLDEAEQFRKKNLTPTREQRQAAEPSPGSKKQKGKERKQKRDQNLITNADSSIPDFDFEKNLALFDKTTVFEQLKESISVGSRKPVIRTYKGNENILESEPVSMRRIQVPLEHTGKEYTTDTGFIVPAISSELRKRLFTQAEKTGLSIEQRVENVGICTCQMALQLVGGERRICPKNAHQAPTIVILAGPHLGGLQAISAARHLANHTVQVILFVPEHSVLLDSQLEVFLKTSGKLLRQPTDLPTQPVDMVIDALTNHDNSEVQNDWLPWVIEWANHKKAPVLALDPCIRSPRQVDIVIKWSIALALPLIGSSKSGRMYLADVGIPDGIYKEVGISYTSPFGDKFIIPLND